MARKEKTPGSKNLQAIRIYVNRELEEIKQGIPAAAEHLDCGGRMVIITFHSLEDRLVKSLFKRLVKRNFKVIMKNSMKSSRCKPDGASAFLLKNR